ncbi:winged helix-turn-helix domain-containing protein [Pacificimonas sp. ICDLI1SI03]
MSELNTKRDEALLATIRNNPGLGVQELSDRLGISPFLVSHSVARLRSKGVQIRNGFVA